MEILDHSLSHSKRPRSSRGWLLIGAVVNLLNTLLIGVVIYGTIQLAQQLDPSIVEEAELMMVNGRMQLIYGTLAVASVGAFVGWVLRRWWGWLLSFAAPLYNSYELLTYFQEESDDEMAVVGMAFLGIYLLFCVYLLLPRTRSAFWSD